jgi:hypothetical protein
MARKKKMKESRANKAGLGYKKSRRAEIKIDGIFDEKLFWSKIYNGFKKFLESPFNQ